MQGGMKNHDLRPISCFILELMQDRAIVTMEGEWETIPKLSNDTILNDLLLLLPILVKLRERR